MPTTDENGINTYDNNNYSAPVHAVIGMAGFTLDKFKTDVSRSFYPSQVCLYVIYMYIFMPSYVIGEV
jgi:hypothetical protein